MYVLPMAPTDVTLTNWFDDHRQFLWGLSYRITGSTADADDVRRPPRLLLSIDLNTEGEIANVWVIASSSKLATVPSRTKAS